MNETLENRTERTDKKRIIKTIIKYVKKLSNSDLDRLLEYLNYLIAN